MQLRNECRPHFSISQLTDYLNCPFAYYLRHVAGLSWKSTPPAVAFGGTIHRTIEYMHKCQMHGSVDRDDVLTAFHHDWAANIDGNNISWRKPDESAELQAKGQALVELYYDKFHSHRYSEVELGFRLPILDPSTGLFVSSRDMVGRIDAIDGGNSLVEVKTTSRKPSQTQVDSGLQITLYSWAYRMLYGVPEDRIIVVNLVKTKEPRIVVLETQREEEDYTKLIGLVDQVLRAIDSHLFYPNPIGGYGCGSCNYRDECSDQWPL